jgi:hypothetical protein
VWIRDRSYAPAIRTCYSLLRLLPGWQAHQLIAAPTKSSWFRPEVAS